MSMGTLQAQARAAVTFTPAKGVGFDTNNAVHAVAAYRLLEPQVKMVADVHMYKCKSENMAEWIKCVGKSLMSTIKSIGNGKLGRAVFGRLEAMQVLDIAFSFKRVSMHLEPEDPQNEELIRKFEKVIDDPAIQGKLYKFFTQTLSSNSKSVANNLIDKLSSHFHGQCYQHSK